MVLRRVMDAAVLNRVSNPPSVRPWLGGEGKVDWSPIVEHAGNVALVNEHGGWVFQQLMPGLYEAHSQFLPEGRGRPMFEAAREAIRYLFTHTECTEIVSKVPLANAGAVGLSRWSGFEERFRREGAWTSVNGAPATAVAYVGMTLDAWKKRDPACLHRGQWFHAQLEAAKHAAGSALPVHPEDESHDRAVGASVLRFQAGNPRKAVATYNKWAVFVGYAPIALLQEHPVIVDVGDAIASLKPAADGWALEVLACRGLLSPEE